MNMWYWEHFKPSLMVEAARVSLQMQLSHLLVYKQDQCSIGQHAWEYPGLFQHFIHMLLHNIKLIHTLLILLVVQGVVDFHQQGQWHGQADNVDLTQVAQTYQQIHCIVQYITSQ